MAEPKVVFFTALSDEYREMVTDEAPESDRAIELMKGFIARQLSRVAAAV